MQVATLVFESPKLSLPSIRLSHMRLYPGTAEDLAVLSGWLRFISALRFYYTTFSCVNTPSCLWSVNLLGHSVRWEGRNSKAHFTHRETEAWRHEAPHTHSLPQSHMELKVKAILHYEYKEV